MTVYKDFFEMTENLFETIEKEDLDGVIPINDPAQMLIGYGASLPHSKRTIRHEWWIDLFVMKNIKDDPRYEETMRKLKELMDRSLKRYDEEEFVRNIMES